MHAFTQYGCLTNECQILNCCWMYLLEIWLSELCTRDGTRISNSTWSGALKCEWPYKWHQSIKPTLKEWKFWQAMLSKCFGLDQWHALNNQHEDWYPMPDQGWYLDPATNCLWHLDGQYWLCYSQIPSHSWTKPFYPTAVPNENGPPPPFLQ